MFSYLSLIKNNNVICIVHEILIVHSCTKLYPGGVFPCKVTCYMILLFKQQLFFNLEESINIFNKYKPKTH